VIWSVPTPMFRRRSTSGIRTRSSSMGSAWRPISRRMKSVIRASAEFSAAHSSARALYPQPLQFKLSFEYCLLEPMDLVTITDTLLGLTNVAVRITEIEEDDAGYSRSRPRNSLAARRRRFNIPSRLGRRYPDKSECRSGACQHACYLEPPAALTSGIANVSSRRPAASRRLIRWRRPARQGRTIRNRLMARR